MRVTDLSFNVAVSSSSNSKKWKNISMTWDEIRGRFGTAVQTKETHREFINLPKSEQGLIKDVGAFVGARIDFRGKHNLGEPFAVAQVYKDQAAVVASELHPTHEADFVLEVARVQRAAGMGAHPVAQAFDVLLVFLLQIQILGVNTMFGHGSVLLPGRKHPAQRGY